MLRTLYLTRRKREDHDADDKPDRGEEKSIAEEDAEIHARDARHHDVPERREEVTHVIADPERKHATLDRYADGHGRLNGDETLDRPLPTTRRNETCEYRSGQRGDQR